MDLCSARVRRVAGQNEQGETVWIPGPEAPYEDCWEGEYLGKVRPCRYLHVRRRDTENHTTKVGKVFLREGEQMSRLSLNRLLDRLRSYGFKVYGE